MIEKPTSNFPKFILALVLSFGFILASSIGVFNELFSISEKVQASYRIEVNSRAEDVIEAVGAVSDIAALKRERDDYKDDVIALRQEVSSLKAELKSIEVKNEQIVGDFGGDYQLIPAYVIHYKQEEPGHMVINKGESDGIEKGSILVFNNYVLGEIIEVSRYSSTVRTILASESRVLVVSEIGTKGIMQSKNGRELEIREILSDSQVDVGDDFLTFGKNSNFIPNLYVGEVKEVELQASSTTKVAKIKNEIDFSSLKEVFILKHED